MDLKLHRPHAVCSRTGRPFAAGEPFYSALVRTDAGLERLDISAEAWAAPPERSLAWWRSTHPAAEAIGQTLAPVDVLLDVLEELEGRTEDEPLRYLLALQLVRRRVLKPIDDTTTATDRTLLVLACRRRDREYRVRTVPPREVAAADVEARLAALLWSGAAA